MAQVDRIRIGHRVVDGAAQGNRCRGVRLEHQLLRQIPEGADRRRITGVGIDQTAVDIVVDRGVGVVGAGHADTEVADAGRLVGVVVDDHVFVELVGARSVILLTAARVELLDEDLPRTARDKVQGDGHALAPGRGGDDDVRLQGVERVGVSVDTATVGGRRFVDALREGEGGDARGIGRGRCHRAGAAVRHPDLDPLGGGQFAPLGVDQLNGDFVGAVAVAVVVRVIGAGRAEQCGTGEKRKDFFHCTVFL